MDVTARLLLFVFFQSHPHLIIWDGRPHGRRHTGWQKTHWHTLSYRVVQHLFHIASCEIPENTTTATIDLLWLSNTIWRHRFGSRLAQEMACCLRALSHFLNQCWLIIIVVLWYSPGSTFKETAHATILYIEFENYTYTFKIPTTSPRGQWVNIGEWQLLDHKTWPVINP